MVYAVWAHSILSSDHTYYNLRYLQCLQECAFVFHSSTWTTIWIQYLIPLLLNPCPFSITSHYVIWWSLYSHFKHQRYHRRQTSSLRFISGVARHFGAIRRMDERVGTWRTATAGKSKEPVKKKCANHRSIN